MSLPSYIENLLLNPYAFMAIFFTTGVSFAYVNKIIFRNYLCGLAALQFPTIIVTSIVIDLYYRDLISYQRLLHFIVVEGLLYLSVLVFYRHIIKMPNIKPDLTRFYRNNPWLVVVPAITICLVNLYNVGGPGSRIAFQTSYWYSFIRPISTLFMPLLMMGIFINIYNERYLAAFFLTAMALTISISAGSKGAFIISMICWYLIYRDIFRHSLIKANLTTISFVLACTAGAYVNLVVVGVDLTAVFHRIVSYGDATFLIYQAENPTLACADQSVLSLTHRGFARLIGDPSAIDPSTLFGFAVSQIFYGGHDFTGPNARIGAYTLCAFPGIGVSYMFFIFSVYLVLVKSMFSLKIKGIASYKLSAVFLPFIISSLTASLMDYNRVMSDITFIFMMYVLVMLYLIIPKRRVYYQYEE
jgi:hypothetical protein